MNITLNNLIDEYNTKKGEIMALSVKKMELESIVTTDKFLNDIYSEKIALLNQKQLDLNNELEQIGNKIEIKLGSIESIAARQVIMMRIFTDYTWKYIARVCNYSEARVRQLYRYGVGLLSQ